MRKITTLFLATVFATSSAFAGSVSFTPASVESAFRGDVLVFDVSIEGPTDFATFNSVSLVIGSSELIMDDVELFIYSPDFIAGVTVSQSNIPNPLPPDMTSALAIGGINFFANALSAPIIIGTLTVIVPMDLRDGLYTVEGFGEITNSGTGSAEFLDRGFAIVNVGVPEPATLVLLGIGGIAAMRRRRR